MYLLASLFTLLEVAVFLTALVAFLFTLRFFLSSQKALRHLLTEPKRRSFLGLELDRDGFVVPASKAPPARALKKAEEVETQTQSDIKELRHLLQMQQAELSRAVRQIESLAAKEEDEPADDVDEPQFTNVGELQEKLANREAELLELRQQLELSQKMQGHFQEVQSGYGELQQKLQRIEQQAWQTADAAIRMDALEQQAEQLEKSLQKKDDKLRELTVENGRLHESLNEVEDKLTEANLQRQQLQKKVQFLEEVNSDVQQISEANRKLRTELRRVAELESMLNLITEERDALLNRRR